MEFVFGAGIFLGSLITNCLWLLYYLVYLTDKGDK